MGLFDGLSAKQEEAVRTIDEDLEIIACAGAGKTGVVTRRIAYILDQKKDIMPENIVAFTFTEKAAHELKERIYKYGGEVLGHTRGFSNMYVGTIHGFCLKMLQENIKEFQNFSVLDENKEKIFVNRYYNLCGMSEMKRTKKINDSKDKADIPLEQYSDTHIFVKTISMLLENWEDRSLWTKQIQDIALQYKQFLYKYRFFSYSLIVHEMIEQLKQNREFAEKVYSKVRYLTVDEYQDTNSIQERLVYMLKSAGCNLCVVGDDDQTIYRFRGSVVDNILTFKERYNINKYIVLDVDYRSTKKIVDIAQKVIENNVHRLKKQMTAGAIYEAEENDTVYKEFENGIDEVCFAANRIEELHKLGVPFSEMAVLLRKKIHGANFAKKLGEKGIPYIVEGVTNLFDKAEIDAATEIFYYIQPETRRIDSLRRRWDEAGFKFLDEDFENAVAYLNDVDLEKPYGSQLNLQEIYHEFLGRLHVAEKGADKKDETRFYNLGKFSQIIDDFESIYYDEKPKWKLKSFLYFLKEYAPKVYVEGELENDFIRPDAVNIMTIHKSKGLEFTAVFIPHLNDKDFPVGKHGGCSVGHVVSPSFFSNKHSFDSDIEDERRLFYVAVTRSKKYLFLTRTPMGKKISTFLTEAMASKELIDYNENMGYTNTQLPQVEYKPNSLMLNFSLLQDYFDCPYLFKMSVFYGFVQPIVPEKGYGRVVHNIIQNMHSQYRKNKSLTMNDIENIVDELFYLPYAGPIESRNMLVSAKRVAKSYFKKFGDEFDQIYFVETPIEISLGNGININGRMDLVKRKVHEGTEQITIVDFKSAGHSLQECLNTNQLKIYALGYETLTGKKPDYLEIVNLDNGESDRNAVSEKMLCDVKNDIQSAAEYIRKNTLSKNCEQEKCNKCYLNYLCMNNMDDSLCEH